ncbi:hypothetical protein [uncultured Roseibium sp.]|uniref:hypothetical protein n=1 Tax=uncultured Roseibium sp. TaxID=1936171 RepID=UPI00260455AF|nr:hypothetical protein [uncultured Roseibium sp.]
MSEDKSSEPGAITIVISLILTTALTAVAYYAWTYANIGARQWDVTKNSLTTDLRFFVGLLAVFVVLTFLDKIIEFVKSKIGDGH